MTLRRHLLSVMFLVVSLAPASALADPGKSGFDLGIWGQMQLTSLQSLAAVRYYSGTDLQFYLSWKSIGGAVGVAYERLQPREPEEPGVHHGGNVHLVFQWRFVQVISRELFHWIDPHVDVGGILGGVSENGAQRFRGAAYFGAGLDVRVLPSAYHLLLTAQYRFYLRQAPYERTLHHLFLGLGIRITDG